jgi:hypothetical protein
VSGLVLRVVLGNEGGFRVAHGRTLLMIALWAAAGCDGPTPTQPRPVIGAEGPPILFNEVYGNPVTVNVAPGPELMLFIGLGQGVSTTRSFKVKTSFEPF